MVKSNGESFRVNVGVISALQPRSSLWRVLLLYMLLRLPTTFYFNFSSENKTKISIEASNAQRCYYLSSCVSYHHLQTFPSLPLAPNARSTTDALRSLPTPPRRLRRSHNPLLLLRKAIYLIAANEPTSRQPRRCRTDSYNVPADRAERDHMGFAEKWRECECYHGENSGERES